MSKKLWVDHWGEFGISFHSEGNEAEGYLQFYGFREPPFGVTPSVRHFYPSRTHEAALRSLIFGIETGLGFGALIAEPGLGKTSLLFRILEYFRYTALTAFVFQTQCDSNEFLRYLLKELDPAFDLQERDPVVLHEHFLRLAETAAARGQSVIVIVDEAQNLRDSVLESIRLLSNFETPDSKLIHIILAGQPRLEATLMQAQMAQLRDRISSVNRLEPLGVEDTARYVNHRLKVAGYSGDQLFTLEALDEIAVLSGGNPRSINHVCRRGLMRGFALGKTQIDRGDLKVEDAEFPVPLLPRKTGDAPAPREVGVAFRVAVPGLKSKNGQSLMESEAPGGTSGPEQPRLGPVPHPAVHDSEEENDALHNSVVTQEKERWSEIRRGARAVVLNHVFRTIVRLGALVLATSDVAGSVIALLQSPHDLRQESQPAASEGAEKEAVGQRSAVQFSVRHPRYRLRPGDVIEIQFSPTADFNQTVSVQPDGFIVLREVGELRVQDLTLAETTQAVRMSYQNILKEPTVTVLLKDFEKPHFIVNGQVGRPGKYELRASTTVSEAIGIAGGLTDRAKHSQVLLFRRISDEWCEVKKLDLKAIYRGELKEDVHLRPGDMLFVPQNAISKVKPYLPVSSIGTYLGVGPR